MKSFLRTFGIALFLVGALLAVGKQWQIPVLSSEVIADTKKQDARIAELEQQLSEANAQVAELQQTVAHAELEEEQEVVTTEPAENGDAVSETDDNVVSGVVYIYEGVSIYDIGKQVEDAGILANGRELELFLSKREYSRSIQKGHFELNSSMTLEQMARILTGKKVQ
ncbi:hypothetical protein P9B03_16345 [Metasolibacillus meyeri]|uniref:YceG-like family protein n=1 Tax=Metasolibacillus meyeri TaxID=1071052 RepID=A0AAW9NUV3_9BACL|nr:hypothetical protein [Metasolibacillus meyeri]MEC1180073.1 hypothetical protein [Metasolibacillus meyeri]